LALTKIFDGREYIHDKDGTFTRKEDAQAHADWLSKQYQFIKHTKVEEKDNGTYLVWWSYR
jgi:hypothetical protein